jgi:hypothetical protein
MQKSNRNFGLVFSGLFGLLGVMERANSLCFLSCLILAIALLLLAFFKTSALALPNTYWLKFGHLVSWVTTPVILFFFFFFFFTPISLIVRMFIKNAFKLRPPQKAETYWLNSPAATSTMHDQF